MQEIEASLHEKTAVFKDQVESKQQELAPWSRQLNELQSTHDLLQSERDMFANRSAQVCLSVSVMFEGKELWVYNIYILGFCIYYILAFKYICAIRPRHSWKRPSLVRSKPLPVFQSARLKSKLCKSEKGNSTRN